MIEERNETVAKGINFLLDMAANMGKMAVNQVFKVETMTEEEVKKAGKLEIKKSFRKQLRKMILDFLGDEEDEQETKDK